VVPGCSNAEKYLFDNVRCLQCGSGEVILSMNIRPGALFQIKNALILFILLVSDCCSMLYVIICYMYWTIGLLDYWTIGLTTLRYISLN
jgi:hypothetical protein